MEQLTQIGTLNGGKVYVPLLTTGFSPAPADEYVFFLQSRCRIVMKEMTSAVRMEIMFGPDLFVMTLFPDLSGNIHAPIGDVLAAKFERVDNNTMTVSGIDGQIDLYAIDANGGILDTMGIFAYVCDCSSFRSGYGRGGGFDHLLPDTFRLPASLSFNEFSYIGCRLTRGVNRVELAAGGLTYNYQQPYSDGRAVGCNLDAKGKPSALRAYENTTDLVEVAMFERVDCLDDKLFLRWWSVEDGIWKTRLADVAGESAEISGTTNYIRDFQDMQAKSATTSVVAEFPSLSPRDYSYYRDLMYSDEVYIVAGADTADSLNEIVCIPVTIFGSVPETKANRRTTIKFNVNYNKFSEL